MSCYGACAVAEIAFRLGYQSRGYLQFGQKLPWTKRVRVTRGLKGFCSICFDRINMFCHYKACNFVAYNIIK